MFYLLLLPAVHASTSLKTRFNQVFDAYQQVTPGIAQLSAAVEAIGAPYQRLQAAADLANTQVYGPTGPFLDSMSRLAAGYTGASAADASNLVAGMKQLSSDLSKLISDSAVSNWPTMLQYLVQLEAVANATIRNQWSNQLLLASRASWSLSRAIAISQNQSSEAAAQLGSLMRDGEAMYTKSHPGDLDDIRTSVDALIPSLQDVKDAAAERLTAAATAGTRKGERKLADTVSDLIESLKRHVELQSHNLRASIETAIENERVTSTAESVQWFSNLSATAHNLKLQAEHMLDDAWAAARRSALNASARNELMKSAAMESIKAVNARIAAADAAIANKQSRLTHWATESSDEVANLIDAISEAKTSAVKSIATTAQKQNQTLFDSLTALYDEQNELTIRAIQKAKTMQKTGSDSVQAFRSQQASNVIDVLKDVAPLLQLIDAFHSRYDALIAKKIDAGLSSQTAYANDAESRLGSAAAALANYSLQSSQSNRNASIVARNQSSNFIDDLVTLAGRSSSDVADDLLSMTKSAAANALKHASLSANITRTGSQALAKLGSLMTQQHEMRNALHASALTSMAMIANVSSSAGEAAATIGDLVNAYVTSSERRANTSMVSDLVTQRTEMIKAAQGVIYQLRGIDDSFQAAVAKAVNDIDLINKALNQSRSGLANRFQNLKDYLTDSNASLASKMSSFKNDLDDKATTANASLAAAEARMVAKVVAERSKSLRRVLSDVTTRHERDIQSVVTKVLGEIQIAESRLQSGQAIIKKRADAYNQSIRSMNDSVMTQSAREAAALQSVAAYRLQLERDYQNSYDSINARNLTQTRRLKDIWSNFTAEMADAVPMLNDRLANISSQYYADSLDLVNLTYPQVTTSADAGVSNLAMLVSRLANLSGNATRLLHAFLSGELNPLGNGTLLNLTSSLIDQFKTAADVADAQLAAGSDLFSAGGTASLALMKTSADTVQDAIALVDGAVASKSSKANVAFQRAAIENLANILLAQNATVSTTNLLVDGAANLSAASSQSRAASMAAYNHLKILNNVIDETLKDKLHMISSRYSDYNSIPAFADAALVSHALRDVVELMRSLNPPKLEHTDLVDLFKVFNMSIKGEVSHALDHLTGAIQIIQRNAQRQMQYQLDLERFVNSTLARVGKIRNHSVTVRDFATAAKSEIFNLLDSLVFNSSKRAAAQITSSQAVINNLVSNMLGSINSAR